MNIIKKINIDNIDTYLKTISIAVDTILVQDDGKEYTLEHHRCAFVPGDFDKLAQHLKDQDPDNEHQDIIDIVSIMWTSDVVNQYQKQLQNNND